MAWTYRAIYSHDPNAARRDYCNEERFPVERDRVTLWDARMPSPTQTLETRGSRSHHNVMEPETRSGRSHHTVTQDLEPETRRGRSHHTVTQDLEPETRSRRSHHTVTQDLEPETRSRRSHHTVTQVLEPPTLQPPVSLPDSLVHKGKPSRSNRASRDTVYLESPRYRRDRSETRYETTRPEGPTDSLCEREREMAWHEDPWEREFSHVVSHERSSEMDRYHRDYSPRYDRGYDSSDRYYDSYDREYDRWREPEGYCRRRESSMERYAPAERDYSAQRYVVATDRYGGYEGLQVW